MKRHITKMACLFVLAISAGCADVLPASLGGAAADPDSSMSAVVIAVIDTGINPYYDLMAGTAPVFEGPSPLPFVLSGSGTLEERMGTDRRSWESAELRQLYAFEGTRALAITFTDAYQLRLFDSSAHGAGVNYIVAREAPEAVIVSLQVVTELCTDVCLTHPSVAEAWEWVADQAWIDVVTTSIGAKTPLDARGDPYAARWLSAAERAVQDGKIVLNAAGNEAMPTAAHHHAGPPWIISVGGADALRKGEAVASAKGVDVVANFSDALPSPSLENETWSVSGTSFAVPVVAGTLGNALHIIRATPTAERAGASLLREALNASAVYFDLRQWSPGISENDPMSDLLRPSLPILTQAQMGWGYVNSSLAPEIARRVLEGDLDPPPEKDQAILVQAQYQRAREEYWANWPR